MSGTTGALLLGASFLVGAALIGWRTWRARRSLVVWGRVSDSRDAHAIRKDELRGRVPVVGSAGLCGGPWPVAELRRAKRADVRCPVCVREVGKLEGGGT